MTLDPQIVQALIQGGAVGIALVSLMLIGYIIKVMTNHLTDVTKLLAELSSNVSELGGIIRNWHRDA